LQAAGDSDDRRLVKGDWSCRFRIVQGERIITDDEAIGSDALQAIVNAIACTRGCFNRSGLDAYYDEDLEGTGLPAYLPQGLGRDFDQQLRCLVEKEVEARAKELEARHAESGDVAGEPDEG
jgi:hypothetical protein